MVLILWQTLPEKGRHSSDNEDFVAAQNSRLEVNADVRFGSLADISAATSDVRFTPGSDRESGHVPMVMSALPPKMSAMGQ
jgi:hypothetical protein